MAFFKPSWVISVCTELFIRFYKCESCYIFCESRYIVSRVTYLSGGSCQYWENIFQTIIIQIFYMAQTKRKMKDNSEKALHFLIQQKDVLCVSRVTSLNTAFAGSATLATNDIRFFFFFTDIKYHTWVPLTNNINAIHYEYGELLNEIRFGFLLIQKQR